MVCSLLLHGISWGALPHHILPVHFKGRHMDYCQLTTTIVIVSLPWTSLQVSPIGLFQLHTRNWTDKSWSMCSISPCITRLPSQMADPVSTPANSIWRLLNLTSSLIFGISHFKSLCFPLGDLIVIISEFEHLFKCFLHSWFLSSSVSAIIYPEKLVYLWDADSPTLYFQPWSFL